MYVKNAYIFQILSYLLFRTQSDSKSGWKVGMSQQIDRNRYIMRTNRLIL